MSAALAPAEAAALAPSTHTPKRAAKRGSAAGATAPARCEAAGASGTLAAKRRKLPPSFELHLHDAARKVQRFLRWRRELSRELDPLLQAPIPPRLLVELREPGGAQHRFAAPGLASYFLKTACFSNPLSRRELHAWEVARVMSRLPELEWPLLIATYVARRHLQRLAYETQGFDALLDLEEQIDEQLQTMLGLAEACPFDFELDFVLSELHRYRVMFGELHREDEGRAKSLCLRHDATAERRGLFCPQALAAALKNQRREACRRSRRAPAADAASASSSLLLTALQFRLQLK